jgi:hypothetical protein
MKDGFGNTAVAGGDPRLGTQTGRAGALGALVGDLARADHRVTHVLLDEGHRWGRKRVAIPIGAVRDVDDGVRLTLAKDEVRDLPPVELTESR